MKLATFRALSRGDKVQPMNHGPEYVTNQFIQIVNGEARSFVELANTLTLSEEQAYILSDEVQHPATEIYN